MVYLLQTSQDKDNLRVDHKKFIFYFSLGLIVVIIIFSSLILSKLINDKMKENNISMNSYSDTIRFQSFVSPVEEVHHLQKIYDTVESENNLSVCLSIENIEYKDSCIAHYYTLQAIWENNSAKCLDIQKYIKEDSYVLGCVLYYSITMNRDECNILDNEEKKYICEELYNNYVKG